MISKLKIDISSGQLEVEGSEELVKYIYEDFKNNLNLDRSNFTMKNSLESNPVVRHAEKETKSAKKKVSNGMSKAKPKKAPGFLNSLDLSGTKGGESLKTFYARYNHKTNYERNLIFVYYLQYVEKIDNITLDHVFTCYRNVGQKIPIAIEQSLRDTSKDKGWVDITSIDDIKVPVAGMNHIVHDMSKAG